ncbi:MAG: replicative DNA helicase [Planctomycetota bacterium]|nr:replicative DNA helicase [Planctomycetota bacterium]MDG2084359.1 replicative DNA helicase [Planctomycetota bacterium]
MITQDFAESNLPHNKEAEEFLLGSILFGGMASKAIVDQFRSEFFYFARHQVIFQQIQILLAEEGVIEPVLLIDQMERNGLLENAGGREFVQELGKKVRTSTNALEYGSIVQQTARRRAVIEVCQDVESRAKQGQAPADDLIEEASTLILELADNSRRKNVTNMNEALENVFKLIDARERGENAGVLTGFKDLDEKTNGLQPTDLVIVAGRPSMGKTTFSLNIALHAALKNQVPVAIFSLEMSHDQIAANMLSNAAVVPAHHIYKNQITDPEWERLTNRAVDLSKAPIFIDDSPGLNALTIRSRARLLHQKHNLGLIVIDYLQLLELGGGRAENRQQEISQISRSLKQLARELEVPVLTISQLSRAVESRESKKPQMSDLRESGAIEQDADLIMLLFREEYYKPDSEEAKGLAEVIIAKHRKGSVGSFRLSFRGETLTFAEPPLPSDTF